MDGWDVALLAVAGYVAVTALVRLMIGHRNRLVAELRGKMRAEQKKKRAQQREPRPAERRRAA